MEVEAEEPESKAEARSEPESAEAVRAGSCERETEEGEVVCVVAGGENPVVDEAPVPDSSRGEESESVQVDPPDLTQDAILPQKPTYLRYAFRGGNFFTGIDVTSEESKERRKQRAERFGMSESDEGGKKEAEEEEEGGGLEQRQARAKRFGTKIISDELGRSAKVAKSLPAVPPGELRPEAVFLHGTDEMSNEDVLQLFSVYGPRNVEWIDDSSCNVVWEDVRSAQRALLGVGRNPAALSAEFDGETCVMEVEGGGEDEEKKEEEERGTGEEEKGEGEGEEGEGKGKVEFDPASVRWRLGGPHPRAKRLLLRMATSGDRKVRGAAHLSRYYQKYGNPNPAPRPRPPQDLRKRIKRKRKESAAEEEEGMGEEKKEEEEEEVEAMEVDDGLSHLAKRPRPLHADRRAEESEEVTEGGGEDLRGRIRKKQKRRELKLRLGANPRLVERVQ